MKAYHIIPFIGNMRDQFSIMLGCKVDYGKIKEAKNVIETRDIAALVGLYSPVHETAALLFPDAMALSMVQCVGNRMV